MSSVGNAATPSLIITTVNSTGTNGGNSAHIQNLPPGTTISPVSVKQERHDEAEIQELAAKMVEAQKAAMAKQAAQQQQQMATGRTAQGQQIIPSGPGGQTNILNYLARKPATTNSTQISAGGSVMNGQVINSSGIGNSGSSKSTNGNCSTSNSNTNLTESADKKACDEESQKGHFGWATFGKIYIPYIVRGTEKYCAVRMVEMKLLNKYLSYLHPDIYSSCTCVRSYYISEAEGRLLNEINHKHCDAQFGRDLFTQKDLVVRLSDATKFYQFLDICYRKLLTGSKSLSDRCGFIRINKESVVPYTVRNGEQVVPLFYFEGETENLRQKADYLSGWDLAYLKFCCKVQGIRNELFSSESVAVISLTDIKSYFPNGTEFEDYWPNKVVDSNLLIATRNPGNSVHWTRQPTAPPPKPLTNSNNSIKSNNNNTSSATVSQQARKMPYPTGMQNINTAPRHPVASTIPSSAVSQAGLTAAAVQALANGWPAQGQGNVPSVLTTAQTEQFLRAAAQVQQQQQQQQTQRNYGQASRNQMPNMMAAAAAARQLYGYSNGSAMAAAMSSAAAAINCSQSQAPPPLVRSTSQSQSHMLNCASSIPNIQRSNSCDPNLSMNHHHPASSPYHQSHNQRDKSVATSNAAAAAAVALHQQQQQQQQQHHHHHQRQNQQQRLATEPSLLVNGRNSNSCSQANSLSMPSAAMHLQRQAAAVAAASVYDQPQGRLSVIPDLPVSNLHVPPYKIQKVFVYDNIMVPCINMKAYNDSDQLMTLTDFKDYFFPQVPLDQCKRFIETLAIEMYKGNKRQINTLIEGGKPCSENIPLIKVRDIIKHMPRFRYMLRSNQDQQPPSKRTRIS